MQTARPSLPELDAFGQQPVAAPMLGAMWLSVDEALFGGLDHAFQFGAISDHPALRRSPGTETTAQWADLEIRVGLFGRDLDHTAFDTHLAFQSRPEKRHGSERPRRQLLALGAVVVGEEGEALSIEAF